MQIVPAEHPIDIHLNMVSLAMTEHSDLLYDKRINYQASLLRKCTKLYKQTAISVENNLVAQVYARAENPDIEEFDEIYKRDFTDKKGQSFQEVLEKLTILTHIYNREFQIYLEHGHHETLFQQMFGGVFADLARNSCKEDFYKLNQPYR